MLQKLQKILFALGCLCITQGIFASDFGYPLEKVAKSSCKFQAWSDLTDDCKMDIPKIVNADYTKYKTDTTYRRVYSVLWGATYDYGWDSGYGSHQWVDIATSAGTPVIAIGEGTIITAGNVPGWGNVVTIKHTFSDKTNIYSNYAHLSRIDVKKGDIVKKWQLIGAVGNTGNSYGNHLHFQIDTTDQPHPYYYSSCAKGVDELKVVNTGMCRDFLVKNTIDPIVFLETGNLTTVTPTKETIEHIQENPPIKINPNSIESRQKIIDDEAAEYLGHFTIDIAIDSLGANLEVGQTFTTSLSVRDPQGKPPKGNLPEAGLVIGYDSTALTVFPGTIIALDQGSRTFTVTAKKAGSFPITFSLGKTMLGQRMINVTKKWERLEPTSVEIRVAKTLNLGQESNLYIVPKTKFDSYLTNSPYSTRYKLTVLTGKAKFCNTGKALTASCDPLLVASELEFGYTDTVQGYLQGKIIALDSTPITFAVTKLTDKSTVAKSRVITVKLPIGLTFQNPYYDSVLTGLKMNWWKTVNGYALENREMTTADVTEMMKRILSYRVLKAWSNQIQRAGAKNTLSLFLKKSKSLTEQKWTRGTFAELLLSSLGVSLVKTPSVTLIDEAGTYKDVITTLRTVYRFAWADAYGARYFQPDKAISVSEALFLAESVVK